MPNETGSVVISGTAWTIILTVLSLSGTVISILWAKLGKKEKQIQAKDQEITRLNEDRVQIRERVIESIRAAERQKRGGA